MPDKKSVEELKRQKVESQRAQDIVVMLVFVFMILALLVMLADILPWG